MRALKQARKLIEKQPESNTAQTLSALVVALESETPFALQSLHQLVCGEFELAMALRKQWRPDRYHSSKARLLDLSVQVGAMQQGQKPVVDCPALPCLAWPARHAHRLALR
jgi:hypothetical protein